MGWGGGRGRGGVEVGVCGGGRGWGGVEVGDGVGWR